MRIARTMMVATSVVLGTWLLPEVALAQDFPGTGGCVFCAPCETKDGQPGHEVSDGDGYSGSPHGCGGPQGCLVHGVCGGFAVTPEVIRSLWDAIRTADRPTIPALVARHPERIRFNEHRNAYQAVSCDGVTVIAHIPIRSGLIAKAD